MSTKKQDKNKNQEAAEDVTIENQAAEQEPKEEKQSKTSAGKEKKKSKKSSEQKKLEELQEKYDDLNDKYMRLYSEFDNYRKRTAKERIELQKSASKELIMSILPVVDDLERAIKAFEDHHLSEEARKGIELIYNKLMSILEQKGLKVIDAKGQPFDTDFHEAVTNTPAPSEELKGKNVDVIQNGYTLNGKVIRYAKVVVGQ